MVIAPRRVVLDAEPLTAHSSATAGPAMVRRKSRGHTGPRVPDQFVRCRSANETQYSALLGHREVSDRVDVVRRR